MNQPAVFLLCLFILLMGSGTNAQLTYDTTSYFRSKTSEDSFYLKERHLPPAEIAKMKKERSFWYADSAFKEKLVKYDSYEPVGEKKWFRFLLWFIIIGGFAVGLMWWLAGNNVGLFRKKDLRADGNDAEGMPEDIFAINYQREIDKASAEGNFRLAIRLMFLRLLKNLSDKNVIHYKQDRTNFDYLVQLRPTDYYTPFFRLVRHYEYSWYGHFDVTENGYHVIRNEFDQLENQIEIKQA